MKLSKHELEAAKWIFRAQDITSDGGISKYYTLGKGWCKESYKEVSGYIISTLISLFKKTKEKEYLKRALRIADWLINIQDKEGKWEYVFDTGQIILGLTDIYKIKKQRKYLDSLIKASDWLIKIQNKNGSWSKGEFAFGKKNKILKLFGLFENAHNTRTAWALLKVWEITKEKKYEISAIKNLNHILSKQLLNGYYRDCHTYSHYLVYTASGILESGVILKDKKLINSAILFADNCLKLLRNSKFLEGNYNKNWEILGKKHIVLTSNAQLAILLYQLYKINKNKKYKVTADRLIDFLKKNQNLNTENLGVLGGISGSYPLNRRYCPNQILSWATKFYIDALLLNKKH
jgi:uncharacterized protein YyaL (SSP411 family)